MRYMRDAITFPSDTTLALITFITRHSASYLLPLPNAGDNTPGIFLALL